MWFQQQQLCIRHCINRFLTLPAACCMLWRVRLWLFNLALIWKSVTPLLHNFGFTPFHMAWLYSLPLHNCSTRVCWWCQLSYHIQIILIHMVTWILAFSLYLDIVYKYELERLLPIISWEKISINHLAFDFNNIDIWSDIWMFTLGWNLTKSAFGLSIEFRVLTTLRLLFGHPRM